MRTTCRTVDDMRAADQRALQAGYRICAACGNLAVPNDERATCPSCGYENGPRQVVRVKRI